MKAAKVEKKAEKIVPVNQVDKHDQNGAKVLPAKLINKHVGLANNNAKSVLSEDDENELPQTGENKADTGLVGLIFASLGLFGLVADRKRKN